MIAVVATYVLCPNCNEPHAVIDTTPKQLTCLNPECKTIFAVAEADRGTGPIIQRHPSSKRIKIPLPD